MSQDPQSTLRPPILEEGDTVGIIAPAGPVNRERLEPGVSRLQELGFKTVYSETIFDGDLYFAGGVRRRLNELHEMFRRPDVWAIVCARGGYGSNYLLPYLDCQLIATNRKILCGYSDVTTLLTYLHDKLGLVSLHGPMVSKDFADAGGVHFDSFLSASGGQESWRIGTADSPGLEPIRNGTAEGKLYGGCLSLLVASLGTPYEIQTDGTILFVEDLGEWPYRIDRMLMHLKYAGKLENVKGIVFGEMIDCSPTQDSGYTLQEAIKGVLADVNVPVAFGLRSGHVSGGNITLPIGVRARLTVSETVTLEILEAATVPKAETIKVGRD